MQLLLAPGTGNAVVRRLAYDAALVAKLNHDDWAYIATAIGKDLVPEATAEVQLRALECAAAMPELHVARLLDGDADVEARMLRFVREVRRTSGLEMGGYACSCQSGCCVATKFGLHTRQLHAVPHAICCCVALAVQAMATHCML